MFILLSFNLCHPNINVLCCMTVASVHVTLLPYMVGWKCLFAAEVINISQKRKKLYIWKIKFEVMKPICKPYNNDNNNALGYRRDHIDVVLEIYISAHIKLLL